MGVMVLSPTAGAMLAAVFEGFSDAAKAAIYAAHAESRRLGAPATGSEHLLLGIVTTAPARIFAGTGATPAEVERLIAIVGPALPERPDRWSPSGTQVLEMALRERLALGDPLTEVEHVALAVTNEDAEDSAQILQQLGVSLTELRIALLSRLGHARTEPAPAWPGSAADPRESDSRASGLPTPDEVVVAGFAPDAHAEVINVSYTQPDHAVVQVGFPGNGPYYYLNIYQHHDGGWRMERPRSHDA